MLILTLILPVGGVECCALERVFPSSTLKGPSGEAHVGLFLDDKEGTPICPRPQAPPSLARGAGLPFPPRNQPHVAVLAPVAHSICLDSCEGLEQSGFLKRWDFEGIGLGQLIHPAWSPSLL